MSEKTEEKMNGYVLKDFLTKNVEELEKDYQVIVDAYVAQKYGVELSAAQSQFIGMQVLESAKWKGTEVYGIKALRDIVVKIEAGKIVLCERETVRALFHFLNQYESVGTEFADVQMDTLESISLVIKEINEVENEVRDASMELEAKRQGILPENFAGTQGEAPTVEVETEISADTPKVG